MQTKLPNLNALRVLIQVARLGSFTSAAEALRVTQSAVSKQIAALESDLGQPLFHRFHKRIEITPFGQKIADLASISFAQIENGLREMHAPAPNQIRLHGDADFVELWLFPRLPDFEAQNPDIRISISVTVGMHSPPSNDWDCAVIWGRGDWSGLRFEGLMTNTVFPVAAPDYFAGLERPPRLSDISERALIHDQSRFWWRAFREASGERDLDPNAGRIYNRSSLCLTAAARGDGVTIGDEVTTQALIASGALVCPFPARLPTPDAYYFAYPETSALGDAVQRFRDWLHNEANAHRNFFDHYWRRKAGPA